MHLSGHVLIVFYNYQELESVYFTVVFRDKEVVFISLGLKKVQVSQKYVFLRNMCLYLFVWVTDSAHLLSSYFPVLSVCERLKLSVDLSQSTLTLCLSLSLFHLSRHTTQCQTQRRIWNLSSPPLSVNSHSLTFTSRHSSCGPSKFTPWECIACGLLGNGLTQCQLKMSKVTLILTCRLLSGDVLVSHSLLMFDCFRIRNSESGPGISAYLWSAQRELILIHSQHTAFGSPLGQRVRLLSFSQASEWCLRRAK